MHVPYSLKAYFMSLDIRIFPLTMVKELRVSPCVKNLGMVPISHLQIKCLVYPTFDVI
jgi:hypothetical protein